MVFPEAWLPGYPAWLEYCRDVAVWNHPPVKNSTRGSWKIALSCPAQQRKPCLPLLEESFDDCDGRL
ncbi:MAG: hypothetical protein U0Y68_26015 [Blastocatellia bacterium]